MSAGDLVKAFIANANLTKRYLVELEPDTDTSVARVDLPTAEGQVVIGAVVDDDVLAGNHAAIQIMGEVELIAGAAIAIGAPIQAAVGGKALTGVPATDYVIGYAIEEATADGDYFLAILVHVGTGST